MAVKLRLFLMYGGQRSEIPALLAANEETSSGLLVLCELHEVSFISDFIKILYFLALKKKIFLQFFFFFLIFDDFISKRRLTANFCLHSVLPSLMETTASVELSRNG